MFAGTEIIGSVGRHCRRDLQCRDIKVAFVEGIYHEEQLPSAQVQHVRGPWQSYATSSNNTMIECDWHEAFAFKFTLQV